MGCILCGDPEREAEPPLRDQIVGESKQKNLPGCEYMTWVAKLSIMSSYLCVDSERGKDPLLINTCGVCNVTPLLIRRQDQDPSKIQARGVSVGPSMREFGYGVKGWQGK